VFCASKEILVKVRVLKENAGTERPGRGMQARRRAVKKRDPTLNQLLKLVHKAQRIARLAREEMPTRLQRQRLWKRRRRRESEAIQ
jgi:hypothetical protein